MRVLHVTETFRGGLCTYLEEVVGYQKRDVAFESVALLAPIGDTSESTIKPDSLYTYHRSGRNIPSLLRLMITLLKVVLEYKPRIVHLHSSFAGFVGRLALLPFIIGGRCTVVYTAHGWSFLTTSIEIKRRILVFIERNLARLSSVVVAVSEAERKLAIEAGIPPQRIRVIHNPRSLPSVPVEKSEDDDSSPANLLYVGRLDAAKGFDILLAALAKVKRTDWRLNVVGDAVHDKRPLVPATIREKVLFSGWLSGDKLSSAYLAADCVLIPSRWEAFGLVAIEAMQFQKAVFASNVGGLPEIVEDGITGVLVAPNIEEWVRALDCLDRQELVSMGLKGRQSVIRNFNAEDSNRKLTDVYLGCVKKGVM